MRRSIVVGHCGDSFTEVGEELLLLFMEVFWYSWAQWKDQLEREREREGMVLPLRREAEKSRKDYWHILDFDWNVFEDYRMTWPGIWK